MSARVCARGFAFQLKTMSMAFSPETSAKAFADSSMQIQLNGFEFESLFPIPLLFYIHLLICPFAEFRLSFFFLSSLFRPIHCAWWSLYSTRSACMFFILSACRLVSYFHRFTHSKFMQNIKSFALFSVSDVV